MDISHRRLKVKAEGISIPSQQRLGSISAASKKYIYEIQGMEVEP